ncbi:TetR/AcrR family transcriptional regulator [Bhargavaea ginsengi]|uniref:TetR/AcrR family transcriptional regulator n=1 Tax=Bhargavaea ginsengi TaxID=426757 RepID=UPI00203D09B5|nr:TetR family transcriptional regulator C-terminal domain-containing protein [Bhargavaea ginsengi]MCM3086964.1 TetR/AcrR family transcriptional regulator [Bhargavaea ginsengi]
MPKIVNHEERREQIAEAMWRVILEKGMEGATVRNIAGEAGLSTGALRHYFKDQDELLVYAMRLVNERVEKRAMVILQEELPPKEKVIRVLLEIVPVDEERRAEMDVWFTFQAHIRHRKDLEGAPGHALGAAVSKLFDFLAYEGALKEDLDIELEAERLYSIADGLALHAFLEPDRLRADTVEALIRDSVGKICK